MLDIDMKMIREWIALDLLLSSPLYQVHKYITKQTHLYFKVNAGEDISNKAVCTNFSMQIMRGVGEKER